jgi:hypothetical protein
MDAASQSVLRRPVGGKDGCSRKEIQAAMAMPFLIQYARFLLVI